MLVYRTQEQQTYVTLETIEVESVIDHMGQILT